MVKSQFIARFAAKAAPLSQKDAEFVVNKILDIMAESLSNNQRIEIRGFGSMRLRHREPYEGRNPKSGEAVSVAGRYSIRFKPGEALRERVRAAAEE